MLNLPSELWIFRHHRAFPRAPTKIVWHYIRGKEKEEKKKEREREIKILKNTEIILIEKLLASISMSIPGFVSLAVTLNGMVSVIILLMVNNSIIIIITWSTSRTSKRMSASTCSINAFSIISAIGWTRIINGF